MAEGANQDIRGTHKMDRDITDLIVYGVHKLVGRERPALAVGIIGGIAFIIAGIALLRSKTMDQAMFPLIVLAFLFAYGGFYGLRHLRRKSVTTLQEAEEPWIEHVDE